MKLNVSVSPESGQFEIGENNSLVASGRITILTESGTPDDDWPTPVVDAGPLPLNSDDIYKELRLRGCDYGPTFRGIVSADGTGKVYRRNVRGVPVPPLFRTHVKNLLSSEAICGDQITLKPFSAGALPRTPSPESSCLVSFELVFQA